MTSTSPVPASRRSSGCPPWHVFSAAASRLLRCTRAPALLTLVAVGACADGIAPEDRLTGSADLSRYVAIGNSATMGVLDGALLETGSECSYPALLARQAGRTDFEVPRYADPGIVAFPPNEVGVVDGGRLTITSLSPLVLERQPAGMALNADLDRPYDNLGVSNALLAEARTAIDATTSLIGNPLFDVVFRGNGTWVDQARALEATFITLWLGNNDVLIWAGAGGDDSLAPGLPVPVDVFAQTFGALLDELLAITDQVVLMNLPELTSLPAFTTIPPVVVDPATQRPVTDAEGDPVPLLGPDGPLAPDDLVILSASELLSQGIGIPESLGGTGDPLPDAAVLSVTEQEVGRSATDGYNDVIASEAADHELPVVDVKGLLREVATTGVPAGGVVLTTEYLVGGAFGLDGAHPTCKGYGLIANRLIEVVNDAFEAEIPEVSIEDLEGVALPAPASSPTVVAGFARRP